MTQKNRRIPNSNPKNFVTFVKKFFNYFKEIIRIIREEKPTTSDPASKHSLPDIRNSAARLPGRIREMSNLIKTLRLW